MIKHYNIQVTGKVQGVGFRYHTMKKASELNVKGFVKNKHDHSVYIEAEGEEASLNDFLHWCKKGPQHAYVETFNFSESNIEGFLKFEIKH